MMGITIIVTGLSALMTYVYGRRALNSEAERYQVVTAMIWSLSLGTWATNLINQVLK